jgi:hypothetical protein
MVGGGVRRDEIKRHSQRHLGSVAMKALVRWANERGRDGGMAV